MPALKRTLPILLAATYSDRNQWKRDLVRYGLNQNDKAFEAKLKTAMDTCFERFTKGQL
ncbi:hypothetical protein H9Q10_10755 [Eikenella sp. S3360]|uniref:Uncharacterized protein n=1 Tax=Eikenella glucosivorans TaxID=2766967 RepID=A0ABS0NCT5_9NEIS|nr:hypothetical protein [Eikenella glucosivorans]MBH5330143.1 hypothetical protein [Eikenella glucosivorans]